jgi:hypothetical protein
MGIGAERKRRESAHINELGNTVIAQRRVQAAVAFDAALIGTHQQTSTRS